MLPRLKIAGKNSSQSQRKRFVTPSAREIRPCVFIYLGWRWRARFVARPQLLKQRPCA